MSPAGRCTSWRSGTSGRSMAFMIDSQMDPDSAEFCRRPRICYGPGVRWLLMDSFSKLLMTEHDSGWAPATLSLALSSHLFATFGRCSLELPSVA